MALYDNPFWLLSHVAHSFVYSDETSNAEAVITQGDQRDIVRRCRVHARNDQFPDAFLRPLELLDDASDDEAARSLEIRLDRRTYGRPRCNTEIKLDKLRREQRKNAPQKFVRLANYREQPQEENLTQEELDELFPSKPLTGPENVPSGYQPVSLLSKKIHDYEKEPKSRFDRYVFVDARSAGPEEKTRKLKVFLDMANEADKSYPLVVHVISAAKIVDVIGYICLKYMQEDRQPELTGNPEDYALYMAESDGSIEVDFQPLDAHEPLSKFGFLILGLVDTRKVLEIGTSPSQQQTLKAPKRRMEVVLPDGSFTVIELESTSSMTFGQLIEKAFGRRKPANPRVQYNYNIERKEEPNVALKKDTLVSSVTDTDIFYIVREHSRRRIESSEENPTKNEDGIDFIEQQFSALVAPIYQEFHNVFMLGKMKTRVEVMMGISEDKLEVYPKHNSSRFWRRQKSLSNAMEGVVACDIMERKSAQCWTFRITLHTDHGYKKYLFEADASTVAEVCAKMAVLLDYDGGSEARQDYLAYKERKKENVSQ